MLDSTLQKLGVVQDCLGKRLAKLTISEQRHFCQTVTCKQNQEFITVRARMASHLDSVSSEYANTKRCGFCYSVYCCCLRHTGRMAGVKVIWKLHTATVISFFVKHVIICTFPWRHSIK